MIAIGIDVSKKNIDVFVEHKFFSLANEAKAIEKFFLTIKKEETRIVMEATGRYHRLAHQILDQMGFDVMVINPFQSRHFAKAMNIICKTDKVDAKVLSQYASRMDFKKTPVSSEKEQNLQDLIRYLDDLKKMLLEQTQRLEFAEGFILKSLKKVIEATKQEIKKVSKAIEALIASDKQMQERSDLLTSIPGIGKATAAILLGLVKELGVLSNREVVALTGLAPMNNASGTFDGKRHIQKGRHDVRTSLFMPALGASTQHNQALKKIYNRLIEKGKHPKVALTACMRKLIIFANALLKKGVKWTEKIGDEAFMKEDQQVFRCC